MALVIVGIATADVVTTASLSSEKSSSNMQSAALAIPPTKIVALGLPCTLPL